jgi:aspartate-semialdehyde dehydrogenase
MDPDVPLIVPEVNPDAIDGYKEAQHHRQSQLLDRADGGGAEAAARCREDQARCRLHLPVGFRRGQGGHGRAVRAEPQHLRRRPAEPKKFTKQIAFNVIPHIDSLPGRWLTKEEWKMVVETKKILDPKIKVTATCVRVPVFVGHSEAINIEFENELSAKKAQSILREAPGVMLVDKREDGGYVTPVECVGDYATFVSRVREDPTVENGLALWCVSDNLRKGAALNAVQIAELLGRRHLKKG